MNGTLGALARLPRGFGIKDLVHQPNLGNAYRAQKGAPPGKVDGFILQRLRGLLGEFFAQDGAKSRDEAGPESVTYQS